MQTSTVEIVEKSYQRFMLGGWKLSFDKIGFFNVGYWKGVDPSIEFAQINLIETLASFFTKKDGNILDVACGKGASSKFLTKYFEAKGITGINISERQLQICRLIAPECDFRLMDATKLELDDATFDNVLCIEAAFHFMTRRKFLEEAYRVLKPGGRLAMSDIVVHDLSLIKHITPAFFLEGSWPKENCLESLDAYRESLLDIGFRYARVENTTEHSITALRDFEVKTAEREFKQGLKTLEGLQSAQDIFKGDHWRDGWTWCNVYAIK